jgi:RHS repeat-associated protein
MATVYDANWANPAVPSCDGPMYCGYWFDTETGNDLARNRYYSIALATWLSRDPIGYKGGINLYEYCRDNPTIRTDPLGLADCDKCAPPPTKAECDAAIAHNEDVIARMTRYAMNGTKHTLADGLSAFPAWSNAAGGISDELRKQPCFVQQVYLDIEESRAMTMTSWALWTADWVGSSLPGWLFDNNRWNTGAGDSYIRMEIFRSLAVDKLLKERCKDAK